MKNIALRAPSPRNTQQGAMFGLDARIALAIFGVLSVVAGVAAINVFSQAAVTALTTELSNMKKAYQEFHLSTGDHTTRFLDLVDNQSEILNWNGPYIDLLSDKSRSYGVYSIVEGRQDVAGVPPVPCDAASSAGICASWLKVKDSVAADVDKALDAEASANSGVFRIELQPGGTDDVFFLLGARGQ
jgi:Tfp pilus assembly major pilin PilA